VLLSKNLNLSNNLLASFIFVNILLTAFILLFLSEGGRERGGRERFIVRITRLESIWNPLAWAEAMP
jgi:hypothetical protein